MLSYKSVFASPVINIKLVINICADEELGNPLYISPEDIAVLVEDDLLESLAGSKTMLEPETNIKDREDFDILEDLNKTQYDKFLSSPGDCKYILFVNMEFAPGGIEEVSISSSLYSIFTYKPYAYISRTYNRGIAEEADTFILNSLTELEVSFFPLNRLIEKKEVPLICGVLADKSEVLLPFSQEINIKIYDLLNADGENIEDYLGNDIKIGVRMDNPSYGTITSGIFEKSWNIISPDENGEMVFSYLPPADFQEIPEILTREVINLAPVFYGEFLKGKLQNNVTLILRKPTETEISPEVTPTPGTDMSEDPEVALFKAKLRLDINFVHFSGEDKDRDYAEAIIMIEDKPLKDAQVEIFSFEKSHEPPLGEIIKGDFPGGFIMEEDHDGFYGLGDVPLMGEFPPVLFHEGGTVIFTLRYKGNLLGMKSFSIPYFSVKSPEKNKSYPGGSELKASISDYDKNIIRCDWYNYEMEDKGIMEEYKIPLSQENTFSVIFKPFYKEESRMENLLRVRSYIFGSTDILSPDGFWIYSISTVKEIPYMVEPCAEKKDGSR